MKILWTLQTFWDAPSRKIPSENPELTPLKK